MAAPTFPLLDPADEDALHLNRLLSVDERPFQRITKRLLTKEAIIQQIPTQLPSPPPDQTQAGEIELDAAQPQQRDIEAELARYRDEILLDFAALESTLVRIQLLKRANERERERYAAEKSKILATAEAVRVNTAELRTQLAEAQRMLALKKEYDEEAEKIFRDKSLRSRDVLEAENDKLRAEIEDLEQESREFDGLWLERGVRFDRIIAEGHSLLRYVKGEKDEDEDDDRDQTDTQTGEDGEQKDDVSAVGTPRADAGGATPSHSTAGEGDDGTHAAQNELIQRALRSTLRVPGVASRSGSPSPSTRSEVDKDTEMQDASSRGTPQEINASQQMDLA